MLNDDIEEYLKIKECQISKDHNNEEYYDIEEYNPFLGSVSVYQYQYCYDHQPNIGIGMNHSLVPVSVILVW